MKKVIELTDEQTLQFAKNHHWQAGVINAEGTEEKNPVTYEEFAISKIEEFINCCINEQMKNEIVQPEPTKVKIVLKEIKG